MTPELDYVAPAPATIPHPFAFLWLSIVTGLLVGLLIATAWRAQWPATVPVHTYGGTTWVGDTCHVDGQGTLWCTERG